MDIRFKCNGCGQHIATANELVGLTVACPHCNRQLIVPGTSTIQVPLTESPPLPKTPSISPPPVISAVPAKSKSKGCLIGLLTVVGITIIALFAFPALISGKFSSIKSGSTSVSAKRELFRNAGYGIGYATGKHAHSQGSEIPTRVELDLLAFRLVHDPMFENSTESEKDAWQDGFKDGYRVGFKFIPEKAF